MVDFSKRQWVDLKYRIEDCKRASIFDIHPELKEIHEYKELLQLEMPEEDMKAVSPSKVMVWIIICYTFSLREILPVKVDDRKSYAADIAGFPQKDGVFEKEYQNIIDGKNELVINAIARYLYLQEVHKFTHMVALEELLFNLHKEIMRPIDGSLGSDKRLKSAETAIKCANGAEEQMKNYDAYYQQLFGLDSDNSVSIDKVKDFARGSSEAKAKKYRKKNK